MLNIDRIREMTADELAGIIRVCPCEEKGVECNHDSCHDCRLDWLYEEAGEDTGAAKRGDCRNAAPEELITYADYYCDVAPEGHCVRECWTNDGPLCDFDECPYEKGLVSEDAGARPVDANSALNDLCGSQCGCRIDECGLDELCEKARCIIRQPTIEPEVRHGRWIQQESPNGGHFNCSECGHEFTVPCSEMIDPRDYVCYLDDYCGGCGAKMDGGADDDT